MSIWQEAEFVFVKFGVHHRLDSLLRDQVTFK